MGTCLVQTKGLHSVCFTKILAAIFGPNNPHKNIELQHLQG